MIETRLFIRLAAAAALLVACTGEDTTPPVVRLVAPQTLDTCRAVTLVKAVATDEGGVASAWLLVDGRLLATDSGGRADTFEFDWDTRTLVPGTWHELACVATDRARNADTSPSARVLVDPAAGTRHRGTVAADQTWLPSGNPHIVEGDLRVEARLVIAPGTVVLLAADAAIIVGAGAPGSLRADGTADSIVLFSAASATPEPGSWRAVEFRPLAVLDSNRLRHCVIEFGGAGGRGMVYCESSRIAVEVCSLSGSLGSGIVVSGGRFARFDTNAVTACGSLPLRLSPDCVSSLAPGSRLRGNAVDGIGILGGTLVDSTIWSAFDLPYWVLNTVSVAGPSEPVLTIASACTLLFTDSARLRIGVGGPGGLRADGAFGRITFGPAGAGWPGIEFWEYCLPYAVVMRNCLVDRAGAGSSAGLFVYDSRILLEGTAVRNSASVGVYCVNSGFTLFQDDTVTGSAACPLRIDAGQVASLGTGNSLTGNGHDCIEVVPEPITADARWRDHGIPYSVLGDIDVGSPAIPRLVIDPGAELRFADNAGLRVGRTEPGSLVAVGTPDSITFTSGNPRPGAWRGIELHPQSGRACTLDHCRLLYGGGGGPGIVLINTCVPTIQANEVAWSANYCLALFTTVLDPDVLRATNWLHDWNEDYDDILFEPGLPTTRR
ncbi:hypothetical protein FJY71_04275 [candidate division WOR-3 bacterium]|nr:hypothetical protein [candidate division WOR-3 bacterium]